MHALTKLAVWTGRFTNSKEDVPSPPDFFPPRFLRPYARAILRTIFSTRISNCDAGGNHALPPQPWPSEFERPSSGTAARRVSATYKARMTVRAVARSLL